MRAAGRCYVFGPFTVDSAILWRGHEQLLRGKPVTVLRFLIANRNRVVSRDEVLSEVWPDVTVEDRNLTVCISAIRRATGDPSCTPAYIRTIARHGYRFIAEVTESDGHAPIDAAPMPDTDGTVQLKIERPRCEGGENCSCSVRAGTLVFVINIPDVTFSLRDRISIEIVGCPHGHGLK